jgi:hypothetical protein
MTVHKLVAYLLILPYLSAPNPPKVILRVRATLQLHPPLQLQGTFLRNVLCPKHNISLFTVQLVLYGRKKMAMEKIMILLTELLSK